MDLQSLLKLKIEKELIQELNDHFKNDSLKNIIQQKVQEKIKNNEITIDKPKKKIIIKDNQCCARSMGPRYSDIRCPYPCKDNIDYCFRHSERINEYGYLLFGRFDEKRPSINEKGNKIPWRDTTAMEDIDTIIQYQFMNLKKLIK
tara:strand:- start:469 stop:906 length:438 start_codon:yes stop_codon:yes gene_type:complete